MRYRPDTDCDDKPTMPRDWAEGPIDITSQSRYCPTRPPIFGDLCFREEGSVRVPQGIWAATAHLSACRAAYRGCANGRFPCWPITTQVGNHPGHRQGPPSRADARVSS